MLLVDGFNIVSLCCSDCPKFVISILLCVFKSENVLASPADIMLSALVRKSSTLMMIVLSFSLPVLNPSAGSELIWDTVSIVFANQDVYEWLSKAS